jgi:cytochrome c peroxidase
MHRAAHISILVVLVGVCATVHAGQKPSPELVDLGRHLYFEPRLSGDGSLSCASCHQLDQHGSDGLPLSIGYPGTLYFRRTPSIYNASRRPLFYWDGRLSGKDMPTLVRDHIAEAHFMQADGRLVLERLRQIPYYETTFKEVMGGEPSYGKILNAITAFVGTLNVENAPFDRFIAGESAALGADEKAGWALFNGKAGCVRCHSGTDLSDGLYHNTGVPTNPDIFLEPQRHITFRRFMKTFGVPDYRQRRFDAGLEIITHNAEDTGKFLTPSLRDLNDAGPYMHNGMVPSLEEVIAHYNSGNENLPSLHMNGSEQKNLLAFLKSLKGTPPTIEVPEPKEYEERVLGEN